MRTLYPALFVLSPAQLRFPTHIFQSFRFRNYRLLWFATASSSSGLWLQQVIIGWLAYSLTKSAFWTSLALGLDTLPTLLVGPLGGVLVDRWDRRRALVLIYLYQTVIVLAFGLMVFLDFAEMWHIFVFVLLVGVSWVITDPARMALIPNIVPREGLVNAFALNGMAFGITRLVAPILGGALLAVGGAGPALLLEGAMILAAGVLASRLQLATSANLQRRLTSTLGDLVEGARYVKNDSMLLGLFCCGAIPPLLVMPFVHGLMPVYAAEVFHVGARGLGLLMAGIGAGMTIGTLVLASLGGLHYKGRLVFCGLVLMGVGMVALSRTHSFGLAFPCIMLVSSGMVLVFATSNAIIQSVVTDDLRGRVSSLYMLNFGLFPAGSLLAGTLADWLTAPAATLIAAAILGLISVAMVLTFRAVWRFK